MRPPNEPDSPLLALIPERHSRKCQICRHPDRKWIEQDYLDWFKAADIARNYQIDDSALHRHLRAAGLLSRRHENLRSALDRILERGVERPISGTTIIRAVKAYTCLTDDNRGVEPGKRVVHVTKAMPEAAS